MDITAVVISVNVGKPRELTVRGRTRLTGIFKEPVEGPVALRGTSVGDDVQVDRKNHGGEYQAVYAYATEDYEWWSRELERALVPGEFGENITSSGLDLSGAVIGERWKIGTAILEVTDPRIPCSTLRSRLGEPGFVKRFAAAERFGAYLRIAEDGVVTRGDPIECLYRPDHAVTVVDVARAHYSKDPEDMRRLYERAGRPKHFEERMSRSV